MTTKAVISLNGQSLNKKDFMDAVNHEIITLNDTGDINHVMVVLDGLDKVEGITGHAKARLLWAANEWYRSNIPGENFIDHVESTTSIKGVTAKRYITVQRYIEDEVIPKDIQERPMRDLVPIATTLSQGYDLSKDDWRKIRLASSSSELGEILRGIKGKKERKSARLIKLSRDGSIFGYKDNKKYFIGFLNLKEAQDDIVLAEFIEKIKIGAGMLEE